MSQSILITGATGFIGSHLLPQLNNSQISLALPTQSDSRYKTIVVGEIDDEKRDNPSNCRIFPAKKGFSGVNAT